VLPFKKITWWASVRRGFLFGFAFFVVTAAYIWWGDLWVQWMARDVAEATRMQTYKGLGFMGLSALSIALVEGINHHRRQKRQQCMLAADRRSVAGVMASSVAHDINNMLTSALLEAELLERGMAGPQAGSHLKKSLLEIASLTRRLRDFGKDQLSVELESRDLATVVSEAVTITRKHPGLRHARVETDLQSGLIVSSESSQIHQIVLNLMLNSAEASERARIRVRLYRDKDRAVLQVEDDGPGIPERMRGQIFEPFHTTKAKGTGLGLASVKAGVSLHNGEITYKASEWGGACFVISLPMQEKTAGPD